MSENDGGIVAIRQSPSQKSKIFASPLEVNCREAAREAALGRYTRGTFGFPTRKRF